MAKYAKFNRYLALQPVIFSMVDLDTFQLHRYIYFTKAHKNEVIAEKNQLLTLSGYPENRIFND